MSQVYKSVYKSSDEFPHWPLPAAARASAVQVLFLLLTQLSGITDIGEVAAICEKNGGLRFE